MTLLFNVWMRPAEDNSCYEYITLYVGALAISATESKKMSSDLQSKQHFKLKGTGPLTHHLGCTYTRDPGGTLVVDPTKSIKKILKACEFTFGSKRKKAMPPLEESGHPDLDTTELMNRSGNTRLSSDN